MVVQVCTKLKCSAEQFKWLWAIRSIVEKIMLRECRTVADRFVDYCKRAAKEGADHMVSTAYSDNIAWHLTSQFQVKSAATAVLLLRQALK